MNKIKKDIAFVVWLGFMFFIIGCAHKMANYAYVSQTPQDIYEIGHISIKDIQKGKWTLEQLRLAGERLFVAQFTKDRGMGRPGATGNPNPTRRPLGTEVPFTRTAGPDANSCFSCHHSPSVGGAGDFTSNVFTGLGSRQPIMFSTASDFSAERGTPEINGAGLIELLAREMTADLHHIKKEVKEKALSTGQNIRRELITKGVSFGYLTAEPDGTLRLHEVEGIDRDLVVRPWGQKGTVTSLRTFTVNAENLHHGLQAEERFGYHLTGSMDFDRDKVRNELTEGDITALIVFQVGLNTPGIVLPADKKAREKVNRGKVIFNNSKCASCHIPQLKLNNPVFAEPGPYNLEGTLRNHEIKSPLLIDLTKDIDRPRLTETKEGYYMVRAFTDLKRHKISDPERPHFGNEVLVEGFTATNEFLTKRLWAVGNTAPYGHRGDLTTLREAIEHHGGEARASRIEFEKMTYEDQEAIIAFLESLQILPPNTRKGIVYQEKTKKLPYQETTQNE
ncbi:di-heme oxidoredictase family protein [Ascidiimonas aurantiaca]|uniref:di-heme oxidoredictase family protein n=1 Tax=Ascidiimonas aurantiaca TaxID=1685432 RepID=UPI0030EDC220